MQAAPAVLELTTQETEVTSNLNPTQEWQGPKLPISESSPRSKSITLFKIRKTSQKHPGLL